MLPSIVRFKLVSVGGRAHDLLRDAAKGHKTVDIRPSTHRMHGLPAGPPLATATVGQILHGQSDFDDEAAQFRCPCRLSRRDEILPDRPTRRHTTRNREELMALGARELVPQASRSLDPAAMHASLRYPLVGAQRYDGSVCWN